MTNPAAELRDLFRKWYEEEANSATQQRRIDTNDGIWESIRAAQLVDEIRRELCFLQQHSYRVDAYSEALTSWARVVFHAPHRWNEDKMSLERYDMLEALIPLLDAVHQRTAGIDEAGIREHLDSISELVSTDADLRDDLRTYILKSVHHLRGLLDDDRAGLTFELGEALSKLSILLDAAAWQSESQRSTYSKASEYFRHPVFSGVIGAALTTAGAVGMKMLGN